MISESELLEKTVTIGNQLGLHARVATALVQTMKRHTCQVTVAKDGMEVDARSVLGLLLLAATPGAELIIRAQGPGSQRSCRTNKQIIGEQWFRPCWIKTAKLSEQGPKEIPQNTMLKGIGVSVGIGIGQVVLMERLVTEICPCRILTPEEIPGEVARFEEAVENAEKRLKTIKSHIDSDHPLEDHSYILDTHILLLRDKMLYEGTKRAIEQGRQNAEWALSEVMSKITAAFDSIDDEYLRERALDVHFVGERVLKILLGVSSEKKIYQLPASSILVSHDLSPADAAQLKKESVLAIATDMGGRTSHSAIMSRSLKIPAVTGLEKISKLVQDWGHNHC